MYYVGLTYSLLPVIINCYRNPFFVPKNESVYSHRSLSIVKYFLQVSRIWPQGIVRYKIGKCPTILFYYTYLLLLNSMYIKLKINISGHLNLVLVILYIIVYDLKVECIA